MDRSHFFFPFELSCPARPVKRRLGGLSGLAFGLPKIGSCSPCLHCTEWSCVVLCDSPRRHNGSGRDWPDSAVKLVDDLAGESPASAGFPVGTVVIPGDGAGDQTIESPGVKVLDGWMRIWSAPTGGQAKQQVVAQANRS